MKGGGGGWELDHRKGEARSCRKSGSMENQLLWWKENLERKPARERIAACPSAERAQAALHWP